MSDWPKLSQQCWPAKDLTITCQLCGGTEMDTHRWREHDEHDEPTDVVIILCLTCSDKHIEPHPRLYSRMQYHEPHPGSMPTCEACRFREGTKCTNPSTKANGGTGLELKFPKPTVAFMDFERKGVRSGSQHVFYSAKVTCEAREAKP